MVELTMTRRDQEEAPYQTYSTISPRPQSGGWAGNRVPGMSATRKRMADALRSQAHRAASDAAIGLFNGGQSSGPESYAPDRKEVHPRSGHPRLAVDADPLGASWGPSEDASDGAHLR